MGGEQKVVEEVMEVKEVITNKIKIYGSKRITRKNS